MEAWGSGQEQNCAKRARSHWAVLKGASGLENINSVFVSAVNDCTTWELWKHARIEKYANPWPSWHRFLTTNTYEVLIAEYFKHAQGKPIPSVQWETNARKKSEFFIEELFWLGNFKQIWGIPGNASVSCRLGFGKTIFVKFYLKLVKID